MIVRKSMDFALANLMDVVAQYGSVAGVDDPAERMTVELAGVTYSFIVQGGNDVGNDDPIVMLTAIGGRTVFVEETAGSYVVDAKVGGYLAYRFATHGTCVPCQHGTHVGCERQAEVGLCRCLCGFEWSVARARHALGIEADLRIVAAPPAITAAPKVHEGEVLPSRTELDGHCGCECQTGGSCHDCGHAGCAIR